MGYPPARIHDSHAGFKALKLTFCSGSNPTAICNSLLRNCFPLYTGSGSTMPVLQIWAWTGNIFYRPLLLFFSDSFYGLRQKIKQNKTHHQPNNPHSNSNQPTNQKKKTPNTTLQKNKNKLKTPIKPNKKTPHQTWWNKSEEQEVQQQRATLTTSYLQEELINHSEVNPQHNCCI